MNKVVLIGRLTKDAALRYTPQGVAVASFTIAVNRPYRDENGDTQADFINCVAWRAQGEFLANYTKKGYLIAVAGSIQTRNYQGQDGKTVYITEVLCDQVQNLEPREKASGGNTEPAPKVSPNDVNGDDLPF